jgi:hypothetical protein
VAAAIIRITSIRVTSIGLWSVRETPDFMASMMENRASAGRSWIERSDVATAKSAIQCIWIEIFALGRVVAKSSGTHIERLFAR